MGTGTPPKGHVTAAFDKITMADEAKVFVEKCRKALSKHTGPIANFFVKEAVVSLAVNGRFSRTQLQQLVDALEKKIDVDADREEFRKAVV